MQLQENMNACYIQANNNLDIETLETNLSSEKELFSISGIDIYKKEKDIKEMKYGYDFYIYDMGVLEEIKNYALDKLKTNLINTKSITNSTNYLIACIYNAISEYHTDSEIESKMDYVT